MCFIAAPDAERLQISLPPSRKNMDCEPPGPRNSEQVWRCSCTESRLRRAASMDVSAVLSAAGIGAGSLVLAAFALRRGGTNRLTVPTTAKCFVSGLLCALGLLVMLPAALKQLPKHESPERVLQVFFAAPLLMFFVHHVLLDHQHGDGHVHQPAAPNGSSDAEDLEASCVCQSMPAKEDPPNRRPLFNNWKGFNKPTSCPPVNTPLAKPKLPPAPSPPTNRTSLWIFVEVLLRATPFTIHAFIDGALLGSAHSATILAPLVMCVGLCAVQDVGTILLSLSASGATRHVKLITIGCFAAGFPLGALVTVAAVGGVSDGAFQLTLRAFAAGVFLYMALFEMAPPGHTHGRLANGRHLCAFVAGVGLVLLSEAVETWAVGLIFADASSSAVAGSATASAVTVAAAPVLTPPAVPSTLLDQYHADVQYRAAEGWHAFGRKGLSVDRTSMSLQPSVT